MRQQIISEIRRFALVTSIFWWALLSRPAVLAATFVTDTYAGKAAGHFDYRGRWEHVRNLRDGRFYGTSSRTATPGAVVTLIFVGSIVRIYGVRGPGGGHGVVTLDGRRFPDPDFYAPEKQARVVVFESPLLRHGSHVLAIAAVGDPRVEGHRSSYINISGAAYE